MVSIDIGCGRKKIPGSVGLDFSPLSDADVVIDLNSEKLPFEDDSVDFIHSSHAFEHLTVDGFLNVMQECYRVLKPDGQIYLLVPYFTTALNFANIFHNNQICFNEHTFRFFSSDLDSSALPVSEYSYPSCPHWGLRYSANSELNMEFRTDRIDFIYMPEYRGMSKAQLISARRSRTDVVEQIAYHLSPVKPCPQRPDRGPVSSNEDQHAFIQGQLDYLEQQVKHVLTMKDNWGLNCKKDDGRVGQLSTVLGDAIANAQSMLDWEKRDDLYVKNGLLYPPHDVIRQLDILIQDVQARIDRAQALFCKAQVSDLI